MDTEIVQVRDVSAEEVAILRERAASRKMSLSSYLREVIHHDATRPTMADVLRRIADRDPVEVGREEIGGFVDDGRV